MVLAADDDCVHERGHQVVGQPPRQVLGRVTQLLNLWVLVAATAARAWRALRAAVAARGLAALVESRDWGIAQSARGHGSGVRANALDQCGVKHRSDGGGQGTAARRMRFALLSGAPRARRSHKCTSTRVSASVRLRSPLRARSLR